MMCRLSKTAINGTFAQKAVSATGYSNVQPRRRPIDTKIRPPCFLLQSKSKLLPTHVHENNPHQNMTYQSRGRSIFEVVLVSPLELEALLVIFYEPSLLSLRFPHSYTHRTGYSNDMARIASTLYHAIITKRQYAS